MYILYKRVLYKACVWLQMRYAKALPTGALTAATDIISMKKRRGSVNDHACEQQVAQRACVDVRGER